MLTQAERIAILTIITLLDSETMTLRLASRFGIERATEIVREGSSAIAKLGSA